jgi:hypothetical protein
LKPLLLRPVPNAADEENKSREAEHDKWREFNKGGGGQSGQGTGDGRDDESHQPPQEQEDDHVADAPE